MGERPGQPRPHAVHRAKSRNGGNAVGPLVSTSWLSTHLTDPNVRPIDCRFRLSDPQYGERQFAIGHIPGAVYFHLERDLSAPASVHGGRHPLPDPERLAKTLENCGVDDLVTVIAYDDASGEMACRLWWLLQYLGHGGGVAALDGGLSAWTREGRAMTRELTTFAHRRFVPRMKSDLLAGEQEVLSAAASGRLIDARAAERYRGEVEPIDPRPGHIPGAVSRPWQDGLADDGRFLPQAGQAARFADLPAEMPLIAYCGSGVTACADLVALSLAGRAGAKLYAGSYSDWCSYPDRPVAVGPLPGAASTSLISPLRSPEAKEDEPCP